MIIENKIWKANFMCSRCGMHMIVRQDSLNKIQYPKACYKEFNGCGRGASSTTFVLESWEIDEEVFTPSEWEEIGSLLKRAGINDGMRQFILARDEYKCAICDETMKKDPTTRSNLHVHHIKPLSKGGSNNPSNLMTLCIACHKWVHQLKRREYSLLGVIMERPVCRCGKTMEIVKQTQTEVQYNCPVCHPDLFPERELSE